MGCWLPCCWLGGACACLVEPDCKLHTRNLKISKESGLSGVAAVTPKVLPAGSATCTVSETSFCIYRTGCAYLVRHEAELIIDSHLEPGVGVPNAKNRRTSKITVGIVTVAKCQTIHIRMRLIISCSIVQESSNTSALDNDQYRSFQT